MLQQSCGETSRQDIVFSFHMLEHVGRRLCLVFRVSNRYDSVASETDVRFLYLDLDEVSVALMTQRALE